VHIPYYDVAMPPEAAAFICENTEWMTLNTMVPKIQALFLAVTAAQIYSTWTMMSKSLWERDDLQLPSTEILL